MEPSKFLLNTSVSTFCSASGVELPLTLISAHIHQRAEFLSTKFTSRFPSWRLCASCRFGGLFFDFNENEE